MPQKDYLIREWNPGGRPSRRSTEGIVNQPLRKLNPVSEVKAKKILRHGKIRGKPLTKKQRRFFGAIAGGAKPRK